MPEQYIYANYHSFEACSKRLKTAWDDTMNLHVPQLVIVTTVPLPMGHITHLCAIM